MAARLRESEQFDNARVVGWESRDGKYHGVYDADGEKVGRAPSDESLERARRVVIQHGDEYMTVGALTPDYNIDEAIAEIEDLYGEKT
jgi:hypothetical protein